MVSGPGSRRRRGECSAIRSASTGEEETEAGTASQASGPSGVPACVLDRLVVLNGGRRTTHHKEPEPRWPGTNSRTPNGRRNRRGRSAMRRSSTGGCSPPGWAALDPATGQVVSDDVIEQAEQSIRNVEAILAAAGCTLQGRREGSGLSYRHGRLSSSERGLRGGVCAEPPRKDVCRRLGIAGARTHEDRDRRLQGRTVMPKPRCRPRAPRPAAGPDPRSPMT